MIFFYIYITTNNIFGIFIFIFSHIHSVVIILVQFYVILVRNGMFYLQQNLKSGYQNLIM